MNLKIVGFKTHKDMINHISKRGSDAYPVVKSGYNKRLEHFYEIEY